MRGVQETHGLSLSALRAQGLGRISPVVKMWCLRALALGLVLCSLCFVWRSYQGMGLFLNLGTDYALYLAQSTVMDSGATSQIYDLSAADGPYRKLLDRYNTDPSYQAWTADIIVGPVPYPPIFAWALRPFTWISPPVSFALWFCLNLCLALIIGWRLASHCGSLDKPTTILLFLGSYPVVLSFYVGQIQIMLAWCITEFYLAMRGGREFRAGMWLGCLLLKPHYGLLLGLLLLWKRRWSAVLGAGAAGSIILGASVLVSGVHGLRAYPAAFSGMAQFRGDDPAVMINWRSVILDLYPSIYGRNGTLLTLALAAATLFSLAWVWRGEWNPNAVDFPVKVLLTLLGTLIASFHSHPYGAVLLAMPLVVVLSSGQFHKTAWWVVGIGAVVPTLILELGYSGSLTNSQFYAHLVLASQVLKVVMFAMFGYFYARVCGLSVAGPDSSRMMRGGWIRARAFIPGIGRAASRVLNP